MWNEQLIREAKEILERVYTPNTTPAREDVLAFTRMDPKDIKVVIIGQDPYPGAGVANGKAFAVNKGNKIPGSLRNLFKEIEAVQGKVYTDETLESWTDQGVLLLNCSLTTLVGESNVHEKEWKGFTNKLIKYLDEVNPNIDWVLWGNYAKKLKSLISSHVVEDAHPSPLSVRHRKQNTFKEIDYIKW